MYFTMEDFIMKLLGP